MMIRVVLAIVVSVILVSCGAGRATPYTVAVTLDEWSIHLGQAVVAGPLVTVSMLNSGARQHELAIWRSPEEQGRPGIPTDLPAEHRAGNLVWLPPLASGSARDASVDLRPGRYLLLCGIPDHYRAGMHAALEVSWP